jgi:hypothetical protein
MFHVERSGGRGAGSARRFIASRIKVAVNGVVMHPMTLDDYFDDHETILARWRRVVGTVTLAPHRPVPMKVMVVGGPSGIVVKVRSVVPHRDTMVPITVDLGQTVTLANALVMSDAHIVDLVYGLMRTVVVHELDEAFLVDGKRVRDPHQAR